MLRSEKFANLRDRGNASCQVEMQAAKEFGIVARLGRSNICLPPALGKSLVDATSDLGSRARHRHLQEEGCDRRQESVGKDAVEGVRVRNTKTGEERTIEVSGFFAAIGHTPATSLFEGQVEMKEGGYIIQKENTMTSVPGVFAAGDVSDTRYRQAVTAAGDGCRAAIDSERWLEEQGEAEDAEDPAVWTAKKDMANF
jgi:hypothetical protein